MIFKRHYYGAIDLSGENIEVLIFNSSGHTLGSGNAKNIGIKHGQIKDSMQAKSDIEKALLRAYYRTGVRVKDVYINTDNYKKHSFTVTKNFQRVITKDDIEDLKGVVAKKVDNPILDIIPFDCVVDDFYYVDTPVGVNVNKLSISFFVITLEDTSIVEFYQSLGLNAKAIASPFLAYNVLNTDERSSGALVINIGAYSTNFSLIKFNKVMLDGTVPIGGVHILKDISELLEIDRQSANYVLNIFKSSKQSYCEIQLKNNSLKVNMPFVSSVIDARIAETIEMSNFQQFSNEIGTIVLTGHFSYLPRVLENIEKQFKIYTRIGYPIEAEPQFALPIYSNVVGIVKKVTENMKKSVTSANLFDRMLNKFKTFLKRRSN